jgi:hypothetical protein
MPPLASRIALSTEVPEGEILVIVGYRAGTLKAKDSAEADFDGRSNAAFEADKSGGLPVS